MALNYCARTVLSFFTFAVMSSSAANAQDDEGESRIIVSPNSPYLSAFLRLKGYSSELGEDSRGNPTIDSKTEDANFTIYFYECSNTSVRQCDSIQFFAGFGMYSDFTADKMNEWNSRYRFGKAFVDDNGDPRVMLNVDFDGGITIDNFYEYLSRWDSILGDFVEFIDF